MDEDAEIKAISQIAEIMSKLDGKTAARVLGWAIDRYGASQSVSLRGGAELGNRSPTPPDEQGYEGLAELIHRANPSTDAERALVAGYWFQRIRGDDGLDAQRVNTGLKHLGYGVSNITSAFGDLMKRDPQLVIQTKKSGKTQQARKRYKLTSQGVSTVEQMIESRETGAGASPPDQDA